MFFFGVREPREISRSERNTSLALASAIRSPDVMGRHASASPGQFNAKTSTTATSVVPPTQWRVAIYCAPLEGGVSIMADSLSLVGATVLSMMACLFGLSSTSRVGDG